MTTLPILEFAGSPRSTLTRTVIILLAVSTGCATGTPEVPVPRPIIIHSGARLRVEQERVQEIHEWVQTEYIEGRQSPISDEEMLIQLLTLREAGG